VLSHGATCANESMLVDRVLVCVIVLCLQSCLIHNFSLKYDKKAKPLLLSLVSCLYPLVIF
jgi:hypothetical protein